MNNCRHAALMAVQGEYYRMWKSQQSDSAAEKATVEMDEVLLQNPDEDTQ